MNGGCGTVGRAVTSASNTYLRFESNHRHLKLIGILIIEKDTNKDKEAGKCPLDFAVWPNLTDTLSDLSKLFPAVV